MIAAASACTARTAIADESSQRKPSFADAMRAHLAVALIELGRLAEATRTDRNVAASGHVARLLAEIDARLGGEISLETLAASLGLTPGYLTSEVGVRAGGPPCNG